MDEDEAQKQVITCKLNEQLVRNAIRCYMFMHPVKNSSGCISHVDSIYVLLEA